MGKTATLASTVFVFAALGATARADGDGAALKAAVTMGDPAIVARLIDQGVAVDAADEQGWTALAYAARLDEPEIATLLVRAGARAWRRDKADSPLMIAAAAGGADVIPALLGGDVPPGAYNDALAVAAGRGDPLAVDRLAAGLPADALARLAQVAKTKADRAAAASGAVTPSAALSLLKVCTEAGLYATERCLSPAVIGRMAAPEPPVPVQDCDRLTAYVHDPDLPPSLKPVYLENLDAAKVILACEAAIQHYPREGRFYAGLGRAYSKTNDERAFAAYKQASDLGSRVGSLELGISYLDDSPVKHDYRQAGIYLAKAAQAGSAAALAALGTMYEDGQGVSRDYGKAMDDLRAAADRGAVNGMVGVGRMLQNGEGTDKKPHAALEWYKKAADRGFRDGVRALAKAYLYGIGLDADPRQGLALLQAQALDGDPYAAEAAGTFYADNRGAFDDPAAAIKWFSLAIDLGSVDALWKLGQLYERGHGIPADHEKQFHLYLRAAEAGSVEGMWRAGVDYAVGNGATKNAAQGRYWLQRAADLGSGEAMFRLTYLVMASHTPGSYQQGLDLLMKSLKARSGGAYKTLVTDRCVGCTGHIVLDIQKRLQQAGAYKGTLTNRIDDATAAAINAYISGPR